LTKCVLLAQRTAKEKCLPAPVRLVAVGSLGGRLDHQLAALSTLHAFMELDLMLLGAEGTAKVLSPGRHTIRPWTTLEGPVCGLVPLGTSGVSSICVPCVNYARASIWIEMVFRVRPLAAGPAQVSTQGLRWDMDATHLAMGHLVRFRSMRSVRLSRPFPERKTIAILLGEYKQSAGGR
jgi:thiamine pyrophosphokinase